MIEVSLIKRDKKGNTNLGKDVWNCWEVSMLLNSGCPINGVLRFSHDAHTKSVLDPRYVKEYLASYHMKQMGDDIDEACYNFECQVKMDLTSALRDGIDCILHTRQNVIAKPFFGDFIIGGRLGYPVCAEYKHNDALLRTWDYSDSDMMMHSDVLSFVDMLTGERVWGEVIFYSRGIKVLSYNPFTEYLVSFRTSEFNREEVVEQIYHDLSTVLTPTELLVGVLFTRQGGIDINCVRASHEKLIHRYTNNLITLAFLQDKGFRQ